MLCRQVHLPPSFSLPTSSVISFPPHLSSQTMLILALVTDQFKASRVSVLQKITILTEKICATISHSSFLSKLTECVIKNRLTQHLSSLLNKPQSAYTLSIIQLSQHFLLFMTTSSKLCLNKSRLYVSWICLLPLISFSCIAYQLGLASMAKLSPGSHVIA